MGDTYYRFPESDACTWMYPYSSPPDYSDFYQSVVVLGRESGQWCNGVIVFRGVAIPKDAEIETCVLKLQGADFYSNPRGKACKVRITCNAVDFAVMPGSPIEAAALARTTAYVDWTVPAEDEEALHSSPELKTILQEMVDREGWDPRGCSVAVLLDDNGSSDGVQKGIVSEQLYIKYATGAVIATRDSFRASPLDCGDWYIPPDDDGYFSQGGVHFGAMSHGFLVFRNVTIPKGARITTCRLKTYGGPSVNDEVGPAYWQEFCRVRITCNAVDSAEPPGDFDEAEALARTTAYADWTVPPLYREAQRSSPELKTVLQEIIDRDGWWSGNDVAVLLHDNGSDDGAMRWAGDSIYIDGNANASELYVEYEHEWLRPFNETLSVLSSVDGLIDDALVDLSIDSQIDALIDGPAESIAVTDRMAAGLIFRETVGDSLDMAGAAIPAMGQLVTETLGLADPTVKAILQRQITTRDGFFAYDNANIGWGVTAESNMEMADAVSSLLGLIVSEWLTLTDAERNNWNGREVITQALNLYDLMSWGKIFDDSVTDVVAFADAPLWRLTISVLEYMGFSSISRAMKSTSSSLNDALSLTDATARAFPASAESILSCVDTATVLAAFIEAVQSILSLGDSSSLTKTMKISASSPMVFADNVVNRGTFYNVLYDGLAMNVLIELDGDIYECYALSTPKFLPSMYSGFDFNSYCVFENRAYGANSTGIYELTGETDAGAVIHTGVVLHDTDFDSHNFKRFRKGYMGISGSSPVMILETEDGTRKVYAISDVGRTTASHEQKSKKWKISIAEFDNLDTIQLVPIILTR